MKMLQIFLEEGPWFRAKRYGYGSGLPFKWQGWVLLIAHMALLLGLAFMFDGQPMILVPLMLLIAFAPMPIYAARTEGGWKWRRGDGA
jgi:hypothetical protein